jgi:hypothetical protein
MQFRAFEPGIEVFGQALSFLVTGFRILPSTGLGYLARFGFTKLGADGKPTFDVDGWYSHEDWLRCFEAIQKDIGENTVFEIGKNVGANAQYPVPVADLHAGMALLDGGYHFFHRKRGRQMFDPATGQMTEGIGHYGYKKEGDRRVVSVCNNPYPCAFDHGIVTGVAQRFQPRARVDHDPGASCRKKGADSCTYVITW